HRQTEGKTMSGHRGDDRTVPGMPDWSAAVRPAQPTDGPTVAEIFLRSFHATLPHIQLAHTDDEAREHFATVVTNERETWVVADDTNTVVGFLSLHDDHVEQLYVLPESTGRGFGRALLDEAKRARPGGLRLYAFQANTGARRFYERHGFDVVDFDDG